MTMKRILTVYEHQPIKISAHFDAEQRTISHSQAALLRKMETSQGKPIFKWGYQQLTPQQWVGYIEIPGLQLEILPKLDQTNTVTQRKIRDNLLHMLVKAGNVPYRESDFASLSTERSTILECYITVFKDKLAGALKRGIIHQYVSQESNEKFLRGKLLVSEQIRKNSFHKERFFVRYDEFSSNNVINRILKATLSKLVMLSKSPENIKGLRNMQHHFEMIETSPFRITDFQQISLSRLHKDYEKLLRMAKVFWQDELPTPASGDQQIFSLLFDMNHIFERYIRSLLREHQAQIFSENLIVSHKRETQHLFQNRHDKGVFALEPDIIIKDNNDQSTHLLIDTKWKRLSPTKHQLGITQADMYQMYGYAREFNCGKVVLLYPEFRTNDTELPTFSNTTIGEQPVEVRICTIDLSIKLPEEKQTIIDRLNQILQ